MRFHFDEKDSSSLWRSQLEGVEPNRAHFDIAALEKDYDVVIVSLSRLFGSEESVIHIKDRATTGVARAIEMLKKANKKV